MFCQGILLPNEGLQLNFRFILEELPIIVILILRICLICSRKRVGSCFCLEYYFGMSFTISTKCLVGSHSSISLSRIWDRVACLKM